MDLRKSEVKLDIPEKLPIVVEKWLKDGKRYFGSSGASLTHQIYNPKYDEKGLDKGPAKAGLSGERDTTKILKDWMEDKPNVVLVDSVHIPGIGARSEEPDEEGIIDVGDTDHILIIGNNVILLDSKAWKNKTTYAVGEDGIITRAKKDFPGGHVNMNAAYHLWEKYLKPIKPDLYAYIVITQKEVFVGRDRNWWRQNFKLITHKDIFDYKDDDGNDISGWLDKLYKETLTEEDKEFINIDLVSMIVRGTIKPYDVEKEKLSLNNVYKLREL